MQSVFFLVLGILLMSPFGQSACKDALSCSACFSATSGTIGSVGSCVWCPVNNGLCIASALAPNCTVRAVDNLAGCAAPCATACQYDQLCDAGVCKCNPLSCPAPSQVCGNEARCRCADGYVVDRVATTNLGRLVCMLNPACGNYTLGCGPNAECTSDKLCKCFSGYIENPPPLVPGATGPGCKLPDTTCTPDTCKIPNAYCFNNQCVCKPGYTANLATKTCDLIPTGSPAVDCSKLGNCRDCDANPQCLWCAGNKAANIPGSCLSNSLSATGLTIANCSTQAIPTPAMCECSEAGCPDGQRCTALGCVCGEGFRLINGVCVSTQDPCSGFVCRTNEQCIVVNSTATAAGSTASGSFLFPACVCQPGYARINDVCTFIPTTCPDATLCNCVVVGDAKRCCPPPYFPDVNAAKCRIKCFDDTFADSLAECPCKPGTVHDLGTQACVLPCPDGSNPRGGFCGVKCSDGMSPNPKYNITSANQEPPCGYTCPDGSFSVTKDGCLDICATTPQRYCPCPTGQVRDLSTILCVPACPIAGTYPTDGKCPASNNCPTGSVPFTDPATSKPACGKQCPDGSTVLFTQECPAVACDSGLVMDTLTRSCVAPCSNGKAPYNGQCPTICTDAASCCSSAVLGSDVCPPPPCPEGQVRLLDNTCVAPCPDGSMPPLSTKVCPQANPCTEKGYVQVGGVCGVYCNSTFFTTNPRDCCLQGFFNPAIQRCICPDGTFPVDGKCRTIDPCATSTGSLNPACGCPYPLKAVDGKCQCPDPVTYPNPFDGRRCGLNACPPGLTSVNNQCVCPITFQFPVKGTDDKGNEVTYCPCDPAQFSGCPVTPLNCRNSNFAKCVCLLNPSSCELVDGVPTIEFCRSNPSTERCFCILNPTAQACLFPTPCSINPDDASCKKGVNCTFKAMIEGHCSREEFCAANPTVPECICAKAGSCSKDGVAIGQNVPYSDIKDAICTKIDAANSSRPECYCRFNQDPHRCYCVNFPQDEKCKNPDGSASIPTPQVNKDEACAAVSKIAGSGACELSKDVQDGTSKVDVHLTESTPKVVDQITVGLEKSGLLGGLIKITRTAQKGPDAPTGSSVDGSNVQITFGFKFDGCGEFIDVDQSNSWTDGDTLLSTKHFDTETWTSTVLTNAEGYTTITLVSADGVYTLSFAIHSAAISLGASNDKPHRNVKFSFDVSYPLDSQNSKLICDFKIVTDQSLTLLGNVANLGNKGVIALDNSGTSGSTEIDVVISGPTDTTTSDASLKLGATYKVYTLQMVPKAIGVGEFHYDPDLYTPSTAPTATNLETNTPAATTSAANSLWTSSTAAAAVLFALFALLWI